MDINPPHKVSLSSLLSSRRPLFPEIVLAGLIVIYLATFISLEYQRYIFLEIEEPADAAANMQTMWSAVNGPFFTTTIHDYMKPVPHNVLGDQLYFTLLAYLPFWLIFKSPFVFVVLTVLTVALAAIPLYILARDRLKNPWLGVILCASFLFNWMSWGTYFRFGFRPETIFIPLLFLAFVFIKREKYMRAIPFIVLVLLTKHNSIIVVSMIGIYLVFQGRRGRNYGLLCLALAIGYYFLVVTPLFSHFSYSPTAHFKRFDEFGASPLEAIFNLALHPGLFINEVSSVELKFLARALFPAGFLCLLSPVFYISLPVILINLLMNDYLSVHCGWHWSLVVPFVYIGTVDTISWIQSRLKGRVPRPLLAGAAILASAVFIVEAGWVNKAVKARDAFYYRRQGVDTGKMIEALKVIEPEASVSTMYRMVWHLAFRRDVYINYRDLRLDTDYVVIIMPLKLPGQRNTDRMLLPAVRDPDSILYRDFSPVVAERNIIIYKRHKKPPVPGL